MSEIRSLVTTGLREFLYYSKSISKYPTFTCLKNDGLEQVYK